MRPGYIRRTKQARNLLAALLLTLVATVGARDQVVPTMSVSVNVVSLLASVRDRHGRLVNNLTADDFVLKEDGIPQKIRYFSQESDLPLTVGLLVDTSRSQSDVLADESAASQTFLDQVLREGKDQAFVTHFDIRVEVLQGLTSSHNQLAAALDRLTIPDEVSTLLFSAVQQSCSGVMSRQPGRKAIILLTDGVAWKDPVSMNAAIEAAQRTDTILYSIRLSDPVHSWRPLRAAVMEGMKQHGKDDLERMSRETGGTSFEVTSQQSVAAIFTQIESELRNQYSLGYTPARSLPDGRYHRIELRTTDRHLTVAARDGYYSR